MYFPENLNCRRYTQDRALASVATVECLRGYERVLGDADLTCTSNFAKTAGVWSPMVPLECTKKDIWCPPLVMKYAELSFQTGFALGDTAGMECPTQP